MLSVCKRAVDHIQCIATLAVEPHGLFHQVRDLGSFRIGSAVSCSD